MLGAEAQAIEHDIKGDERCAALCSPDTPILTRVWTTNRCLVAPASEARRPGFADVEAASAATGWPIVRRRTGGLTVPNGRGVLNLTIAQLAEHPWDFAPHYLRLCGLIAAVLKRHGAHSHVGQVAGAFCDGRYNVVIGERKLAGTAQRWARHCAGMGTIVIAHALILVDLDIDSAVGAVNGYYERLGHPSHFTASSIVTLAALGIDASRFESDLRNAAADIGAPFDDCPKPPSLKTLCLERIS